MHSLEVLIARNAQAAGREGGHADNDDNDRLASAIHSAAIEHAPSRFCGVCVKPKMDHTDADHEFLVEPWDPQVDGPDLNDLSYIYFTTGYLRGRKEG